MFFLEDFPLIQVRAGPIWVHAGPYGPIWTLMGPYGPEISQKICKRIAFIGAFKGPCTLPYAIVCIIPSVGCTVLWYAGLCKFVKTKKGFLKH